MSSRQLEDAQEYRRNQILGDHIGLTAEEVAEYVTDIQEQDNGTGLVIYFSIAMPADVRARIDGLDDNLYINIGPIDFDEEDEGEQ